MKRSHETLRQKLALMAEVIGELIDVIAEQMVQEGRMKFDYAKEFV